MSCGGCIRGGVSADCGMSGIEVCNQRVQVGMTHARKIVTVEVDQTVLRILDPAGAVLTVVARTNTEEGPATTPTAR